MPSVKLGRRTVHYAKLPEELQTKSMSQAKLDAALNATVPEELKKKCEKELDEFQEDLEKAWKKFIKRVAEKYRED